MEQQTQGKNSEYFFELCGKGSSFESIKEVVQKNISFEVTWRDSPASPDMVVRGGSMRGKGGFQETAPEAFAFKKDLGVLLQLRRSQTPRAQTFSGVFCIKGHSKSQMCLGMRWCEVGKFVEEHLCRDAAGDGHIWKPRPKSGQKDQYTVH